MTRFMGSGAVTARAAARRAALVLGVAAGLATGCGGEDGRAPAATVPTAPPKDAIVKPTEVGPVKVAIKVWPARPTLGDPIYARLEIDAPAGISIDAPFQDAGDQRLGRFRVVGFVRDTQRRADGGQHHEQTYTLEAPASGRQRIPPLRLEMLDPQKTKTGTTTTATGSGSATAAATGSGAGAATGSASDPAKQEILTDEVPLEIAPIPAEAAATPLKAALGELDPKVGGVGWLALLGIASALAVLISGSLLAYRALRARRRIELQRSAYDEAVARLRALEDEGPPDDTAADRWFVALSAIVRNYLEQRYEIRAPELTTEEFLQVATARPELTAPHRALLTSFLERCDRVKFAGYRPDADESLATLKAARGFIEDTRLREPIAVAVARPPGGPSAARAAGHGKASGSGSGSGTGSGSGSGTGTGTGTGSGTGSGTGTGSGSGSGTGSGTGTGEAA